MKNLIVAIVLLISCSVPTGPEECFEVFERPVVNLPLTLRQSNWIGVANQGSCVYATMVSLLRWQGRYKTAEDIRQTCGDGANDTKLANVLDQKGIRYAFTNSGDVRFLEWSIRTRRGVGVAVPGRRSSHFVALVHLDSKDAIILDNNSIERYEVIPREIFLTQWRQQGGWVFSVVYTPAAPLPMRR